MVMWRVENVWCFVLCCVWFCPGFPFLFLFFSFAPFPFLFFSFLLSRCTTCSIDELQRSSPSDGKGHELGVFPL